MSETLQIIKTHLSYKQCLSVIDVMLNDITKDSLKITIEKTFSETDLRMYCNLRITYLSKEATIEKELQKKV